MTMTPFLHPAVQLRIADGALPPPPDDFAGGVVDHGDWINAAVIGADRRVYFVAFATINTYDLGPLPTIRPGVLADPFPLNPSPAFPTLAAWTHRQFTGPAGYILPSSIADFRVIEWLARVGPVDPDHAATWRRNSADWNPLGAVDMIRSLLNVLAAIGGDLDEPAIDALIAEAWSAPRPPAPPALDRDAVVQLFQPRSS